MAGVMGALTGLGGGLLRDHFLTEKVIAAHDLVRIGLTIAQAWLVFFLLQRGISAYLCVLVVAGLQWFMEISMLHWRRIPLQVEQNWLRIISVRSN